MANVYAVKTGNWSDPTVWNTGELPTPDDDVYANNFTVTINTSPMVLSISNRAATGITLGGGFTISSNGRTLTANVIASASSTVLRVDISTGNFATINGNLVGSAGPGGGDPLLLSNTGTVTVNGNVLGGSASGGIARGALNQSTGTININGNVIGGGQATAGAFVASHGVLNNAAGTINVVGTVTGGLASASAGIFNNVGGIVNVTGACVGPGPNNASINQAILNNGAGVVNITGDCTGGAASGAHAILNSATGTINITGDAIGGPGSGAAGFVNSSSGTVTHIGIVQASAVAPGVSSGSIAQITTLTGPLISTEGTDTLAAASGVNPCIAARWFVADTALGTFSYTMRGETVSGSPSSRLPRVLALPEGYNASYPLASDVRSPVTFGPDGVYSGTMIIPPTESVIFGVPVDDTTGTATPEINADEVWNFPVDQITTPGSIGERVAQLATVASVGDQIAAMKQASD
jgi:hypothetical protein